MNGTTFSSIDRRTAGRWQPWAFGLLLVAAGLHCLRPLWDDDVFWQLACGRLILLTHSLPLHDPFTYSAIHPWVHDEWLSEVLLAVVEKGLGFAGLRLLCCGLVVSGLALLWFLSPERGEPGRFALVAVAWMGVLPNASVRPHTVAWPLAVGVLAGIAPRAVRAWDGGGSWRSRLLWLGALWLALAVWINLHASALIVPVLLAVAAVGGVIDLLSGRIQRMAWGSWVAGAVALAACAMQPSGLKLFHYAEETARINVRSDEWQPLLTLDSWRAFPGAVLLWCLLLAATAAAGIAERRRRPAAGPAAFPGFWASLACLGLATQYRRMTVFFFVPALFLAPRLAGAWAAASRSSRRLLAAAATVTVAALVFVEVPDALERGPLRNGLYPERATAFLAAADLDGRLFSDLGWGGYLELLRFPHQQVFADGRWLLGGQEMLRDYRTMYGREGTRAEVDRTFARWKVAIVVQSTETVDSFTALAPACWGLAWTDPTATVLLRRNEGFAERRRRVCALYKARPELVPQARWPPQLQTGPGGGSTAIHAVIDECPSSVPAVPERPASPLPPTAPARGACD